MNANRPIDLSPQQAAELLVSDPRAVLIDIRTGAEFLFVGHPLNAVHIPWLDGPDWTCNPDFVAEVRRLLPKDDAGTGGAPVILICRSGQRSLDAGCVLIEQGLNPVYHVAEGFEGERDARGHRSTIGGWRFRGLPWEQD